MNRPDSGANELPPGNNGAHSTTPPPLPSKPFNNGLSNPMINQVYYHSAATMPELENDSISLVVTSPPHFNVKDYSKNGKQNITHSEIKPGDCGSIDDYREYIQAMLPVWQECARVLQPNGKLCINAPLMPMPKAQYPDRHNRTIFNIYADIEHSILANCPEMHLLDLYIWNRSNPTKSLMFGSYPHPPNLYAQNTIEFIGVLVKEGPPPQRQEPAKLESQLSEAEWREFTRQVWNLAIPSRSDPGYDPHPALMPEAIAQRCIRMFSFAGDKVLDPFTGSGTTLKVARELGRIPVGYEIYEHYRTIINRKLTTQMPMPGLLNPVRQ